MQTEFKFIQGVGITEVIIEDNIYDCDTCEDTGYVDTPDITFDSASMNYAGGNSEEVRCTDCQY